MAKDLWDWQDDDCERLRSEGKTALADCWDNLSEIITDWDKLRETADLAQTLKEPHWELFYLHWYVQQMLWRALAPVDYLIQARDRLLKLADDPACADCPQHICAFESALEVLLSYDPVAHADDVRKTVERVLPTVDPETDCYFCMKGLIARTYLHAGRLDEAWACLEKTMAQPGINDNLKFVTLLVQAEVAEERGDAANMGKIVAELSGLADAAGDEINEDNLWYVAQMEITLLIVQERVTEALELAQETLPGIPDASKPFIMANVSLARGCQKQGLWNEALACADVAAKAASFRNFQRHAVECKLIIAEVNLQLGRMDHTLLDEIGEEMRNLESRDLDARARQLGVQL